MNEEDLSPEARQRLKELTPSIDAADNWCIAYVEMLKGLAEETIPPLEDVEIKGQGMAPLKQSRKEHAAAVELKAYAKAFLGPDISAAVAKLPEMATLDEFLDRLMPQMGRDVRRKRFMDFIWYEAGENAKGFPRDGEWIEVQSQARFAMLDRDGVPALVAYDIGESYRAWWKRQEQGNPLGGYNDEKKTSALDRRNALIALLPKRTDDCGITKDEWRREARKADLLSSTRTFNRDVKDIVEAELVHIQKDGRFRQLRKKNASTRKKDLA